MLKDVGLKVEGVHFVETYHEGAKGKRPLGNSFVLVVRAVVS